MIFSPTSRSLLFKVFAALSCLAALYHFVGLFYKVDAAPIWRHTLFVFITLFCFYGFIKRPMYFVYFFGVLLLQQYYSHGTYMFKLWTQTLQIHWISVFDLLLLPIGFMVLLEDYKYKKSNSKM
jgi:hypothetical protein